MAVRGGESSGHSRILLYLLDVILGNVNLSGSNRKGECSEASVTSKTSQRTRPIRE